MSVPPSNLTCQKLLAEALQLSKYIAQAQSTSSDPASGAAQRRQVRLREIQTQLKAFAHPIQRGDIAPQTLPQNIRQAFVRAIALVTRFGDVGGSQWQGSLPSPTLARYQPDPIPAHWLQVDSLPQLCQQFELPLAFAEEITQQLQTIDQRIDHQRHIIQATVATLKLDQPETQQNLWQQLFGLSVPSECLDCIHTDLQLFFCLNYRGQQLYQRNPHGQNSPIPWDNFSLPHRKQLQDFLANLDQFSFTQFERFPIFGACDPIGIDPAFCNRIAEQLQIPNHEVIQTLTRTISIIPTHKAEAFLLHDIWGHHWQFILAPFESDYRTLARCDEPLRAAETAYTPEGPLMYREVFQRRGNQVTVLENRARLFFQGEAQQRLGSLFTHLLGELLADVTEFKWIWDYRDQADQLLSSSLFKTEPTKLDLSLLDLDFLFLQVLKPLLDVQLSALVESPLESDLLADWQRSAEQAPVDEAQLKMALKGAIAQVYQIFLEEHAKTYLPKLESVPGQSPGIFTQIAVNLLYLQNVVNDLYTDDWVAQHPDLPFQDLLLLFISSYCASDSYAEFWDIDDALAQYFLPCWRILLNALA